MKIKVVYVDKIGELVEAIKKKGNIKIESLEWKAFEV
jgi:hypothetical protein